MAITFEVSESNGSTPTVTDGITNCNYGSDDDKNLTRTSSVLPIDGYSYEKWWRIHVDGFATDYTSFDDIRIWKATGTLGSGVTIDANLVTSSYTQDTFATPVDTNSTKADTTMPTAYPASANLGIGGSLTGTLTSDDTYSDYMVSQITTSSATGSEENTWQFMFTGVFNV